MPMCQNESKKPTCNLLSSCHSIFTRHLTMYLHSKHKHTLSFILAIFRAKTYARLRHVKSIYVNITRSAFVSDLHTIKNDIQSVTERYISRFALQKHTNSVCRPRIYVLTKFDIIMWKIIRVQKRRVLIISKTQTRECHALNMYVCMYDVLINHLERIWVTWTCCTLAVRTSRSRGVSRTRTN